MNIWLINHYAVPPQYYPLARTTNFAKHLLAMGHEITIFCASSVHNSDINLIKDGKLYREETVDGVHYVYVGCHGYKGNGIARVLNMLEFPAKLKRVCKNFPKPDAVLASSMTLQAAKCGIQLARKYDAKALVEISDLWPETIVAYGIAGPKNPAVIYLRRMEKWIYVHADAVIFTMEGAYDYIVEQGWETDIPHSKVHYINNGVDLEQFYYNRDHYQIEDADLQNSSQFNVVYTGSIRRVNNLGLLLDAAKEIEDPKVKFLIWGDGDERAILQQRVLTEGITNVVFKGKVEKKYIPYIVSNANLNFMHYSATPILQYGCSMNKLFEYFAANKPILCDFPSKYNPAMKYNAGISIENPTSTNIATAICDLANLSQKQYEGFCEATKKAVKEYNFKDLTEKLASLIQRGGD